MRASLVVPSTVARASRQAAMFAAILLVPSGCESATGPDWRRVVGVVPSGEFPSAALQAPTFAYAGDDVEVTVTTVGSSSCTRPAGAEVAYRGLVAEITPYDWRPPDGTGCTRDRAGFPRAVNLRFPTMGSYTIRVSGRTDDGELSATILEATIEIGGRD